MGVGVDRAWNGSDLMGALARLGCIARSVTLNEGLRASSATFLPSRQTSAVVMLRTLMVMLVCLVSLSTGFVAPTGSLVARPALQESQVQRCVRSGLPMRF